MISMEIFHFEMTGVPRISLGPATGDAKPITGWAMVEDLGTFSHLGSDRVPLNLLADYV